MSTSTGAVKTTLYNLNVLNQLAMACIESLRPEDRGTENQFRFTVTRKTLEDNIQSLSDDGEFSTADFRRTEALRRFIGVLCTLLGVKSEDTITNHIDALINRGVVNDVKNLTSLNIKNENGNGAVLQLGRACRVR